MKKIFVAICLVFSIFSVSVFADTNQDEINQVLSIFNSYKLNYADYYDSNSRRVKQYNPNHYDISYFVYDNRGFEFTIWFKKGPWYGHPEGQSEIIIGTIGKASSKSAQRVKDMRESVEGVQAHLPVQEFINMVRADSRVAVSSRNNSQQYAQNQQKSTQNSQSSQSASSTSTASSNYISITVKELDVFGSDYYGKNVKISNVCVTDADRKGMLIWDSRTWDVVSIVHGLTDSDLRSVINNGDRRLYDVYGTVTKYKSTGKIVLYLTKLDAK